MTPTYTKRQYLSISTLSEFARCQRRYFYQKNGLTSSEEPAAPVYGQAMHKAVPIALETGDIDLALAAFSSVWGEISIADDPKRNHTTARRSLEHFIHTHSGRRSIYVLQPPPAGSLPRDEKTSNYEVAWALDVGLPIPIVGYFDAFVKHRDTGENWIWEFKTTSRLTGAFFDAFELLPQVLTYCLAGRTLIGQDIRGVMVEGMLVDAKKVDNQIQPVLVQEHHLERILRWLHQKGQQLLDCEEKMTLTDDPADAFLQEFDACTPYSHFYMPGYRCEYSDLCRVPDWRSATDFYAIKPPHDFLRLTKNGQTINDSRTTGTSAGDPRHPAPCSDPTASDAIRLATNL